MSNETKTFAIYDNDGLSTHDATPADVLDTYAWGGEDGPIALPADGRSRADLEGLGREDRDSEVTQADEFSIADRLEALARAMNDDSGDWYAEATRFAGNLDLDINEDRTEAEPAGDTIWFEGGWALELSADEWCVQDRREDTVTVETMPAHLRASHEAAGNRGRWPGNGSLRSEMSRDDAEEAVEADPEWTSIV